MCPYLRLDLKDLQNAGLFCLPFHSHCAGPPCAHTRLSRGDEFRATFVAPSCYFRPSGMCVCNCVCRRRFAVPRQSRQSPAQLNNGRAAAVRMSCTTDLDSISPEHHGLSTAHPPGGSRLACMALPSPASLPSPLHRRVKSWGLKSRLKSVLRISGFVVTTAVGKEGFLDSGPVN